MGSSEFDRQEPPTTELIRRISIVGSAILKTSVTRASYLVFYLGVIAALAGLYVGKHISWQYWIVLGLMGLIEIIVWADTRKQNAAKEAAKAPGAPAAP